MNSKNSRTSDPHGLLLILTDKINMLLYQILACTMHGKILKRSLRSNKFKLSAPTWNEEFELLYESYSADIQDYFENILKKHGEKTINSSINICK